MNAFHIFRLVNISAQLTAMNWALGSQLFAQESDDFVENNTPSALNEAPATFSFKLVRHFTLYTAEEERSLRSMVKFYKLKQKWRFELWLGEENEETLDVIQMYDGQKNYLQYPTKGITKTTTDFTKLDNFPSVFMENFGVFGFLVNRGENPSHVISGAIPNELFNPRIWKSSLKNIDPNRDLSQEVKFPLFEGKFSTEHFWYTVQFDRGSLSKPIHISKFSGGSIISEVIVIADQDREGRILDMIPKKVKAFGYDKSGEVILTGSTVLEEWNPEPQIREDLFRIDYSIYREILDLDNKASIPSLHTLP